MDKLSSIQKFVRLFVSKEIFAAMQAESKQWLVKCSNCNHERSIWSMGGIRYKAAGNPRRYRVCPNCGQRSWQVVAKKQ
ncbi:MAG: hypothetical protein HXY38_05670 [Chloroflexi bacterium]|nr:hypothetical protein [Chloroflexota bacterium]